MNRAQEGIVIALALVVTGYFFFVVLPSGAPRQESREAFNLYASGVYGITFAYPDTMILSEEDVVGGCEEEHTVTLLQEEHAVPVVAGGEGPVTITIRICKSEREGEEAIQTWLLNDAGSNFLLGDATYITTEVDGVYAASYIWSGLYTGETIVFTHKGHLFAISVTYMSSADSIRRAYDTVLQSLRLR